MNPNKPQNFGQDEFISIEEPNNLTDDKIEEDVWNSLMKNPEIDARKIIIFVKNGAVKFSGIVDSREMSLAVELAVEKIPGVIEIQNHLKTKRIPKIFSKRKELTFSGKA